MNELHGIGIHDNFIHKHNHFGNGVIWMVSGQKDMKTWKSQNTCLMRLQRKLHHKTLKLTILLLPTKWKANTQFDGRNCTFNVLNGLTLEDQCAWPWWFFTWYQIHKFFAPIIAKQSHFYKTITSCVKKRSTIKTHNLDYFNLYHFKTNIKTNIETNYLNLFNNNNIQNAKP